MRRSETIIFLVPVALLSMLSLRHAKADTLTTPGYVISITSHCKEGMVVCNNVTYRGVNRKSGKSLELPGADLYHYCPGDQGDGPGQTPCHHLGYVFSRGEIAYFVDDDGTLVVTDRKRNKTLLQEHGEWTDE